MRISCTSRGKIPNIMTVRWNNIVCAPTPLLYIGTKWSTSVSWPSQSPIEQAVTFRLFHVHQEHSFSLLNSVNENFMMSMLHLSARWYGNICAVAVLPDKPHSIVLWNSQVSEQFATCHLLILIDHCLTSPSFPSCCLWGTCCSFDCRSILNRITYQDCMMMCIKKYSICWTLWPLSQCLTLAALSGSKSRNLCTIAYWAVLIGSFTLIPMTCWKFCIWSEAGLRG